MEGITLYSIQYYQRTVFKGSYKGMNFRIGKSGDEDNTTLKATAWKGPYILEKTKETPISKEFEFSDQGLMQADQWLQKQQPLITGNIE
ncbi:MAG: hypothetical protein K6G62_04355 [Eubacterium sp.]|nr:hypothetical protein [Eubacterium sp.]